MKDEEKIKTKKNVKITPLPKMKLFLITIMVKNSLKLIIIQMICDKWTFTSIFPYVGFLITDFNVTDNLEEVGYYAGLLASSYFVGQLLTAFFWGYLSDKYGRRPILLSGLLGSTIAALAFSFSTK